MKLLSNYPSRYHYASILRLFLYGQQMTFCALDELEKQGNDIE